MPEYTDNELIEKLETYAKSPAVEGKVIFRGSKMYTWPGFVEEIKKKTPFGVRYLIAVRKSIDRNGGEFPEDFSP